MTNVLPYHVGPENRYSVEFVNPDREAFMEYLADRTMDSGISVKSREITLETDDGFQSLYAVYARRVPELLLEDRTNEDIEHILDTEFTAEHLQILEVILDVFTGITEAVEEETGRFTIYKDIELTKIPEILDYPDWGETPVMVVGGQLLSRFILSHPMPNANHRTAIGLLERYLRSHGDELVVPDTGEQGTWYNWARPYIFDSKRLLTVRRNAHVFQYARQYGVDIVRRKNDVDIPLAEFTLDIDDPLEYYGTEHEERSIDFVETVLDQVNNDTEQFTTTVDPGRTAFVDKLAGD